MAIHITTATTTAIPAAAGIQIVVNTTLAAGTITVNDTAGTQAIITNPAAGLVFPYFGSVGNFSLVTSAPCDISVNVLSRTVI